jgi:hypothetical protein
LRKEERQTKAKTFALEIASLSAARVEIFYDRLIVKSRLSFHPSPISSSFVVMQTSQQSVPPSHHLKKGWMFLTAKRKDINEGGARIGRMERVQKKRDAF